MSERVPRQINVTIDRLVLRGYPPEQRDAITAGLQAELRRHFAELPDHALERHRSQAALRADPFPAPSQPQALGSAAARQIAAGLHGAKAAGVKRAGVKGAGHA
jgi:hypothetical protein